MNFIDFLAEARQSGVKFGCTENGDGFFWTKEPCPDGLLENAARYSGAIEDMVLQQGKIYREENGKYVRIDPPVFPGISEIMK